MAHAATMSARRDVLFHQDAFTVTMVAILLAAGLLFTGLWGASQLLNASYVPVASTLNETATLLDTHADALGADRAADASTLRTLASQLRTDARLFGDDPASNTYASASLLAMKADQLQAEATALASRGAAVGDATLLDCADRMRDAAAMLDAAAQQMRGMLRR